VAGYVSEVIITSPVGSSISSPPNRRSNTTDCEIDERIVVVKLLITGVLVQVSFDIGWEVCVSGFAFPGLRVLSSRDSEPIVIPVTGAFDMIWTHLGHLEGTKPSKRAELDNQVVAT
jgi:hypothetical protein